MRLPNGWILSPVGRQLPVGDFPMNVEVAPDGRHALVLNCGAGAQSIQVVDVEAWNVVQTIPLARAWLGLRWYDGGARFAVSGGNDNRVLLFAFDAGRARLVDSIALGPPWPAGRISVAGIDIDDEAQTLFACAREDSSLYVVDLSRRAVTQRLPLGAIPYTCRIARGRGELYISLWGGAKVLCLDRGSLAVLRTVDVGAHPTDMVFTPDLQRLFVANANENTVSVIALSEGRVIETLTSALRPGLPPGSTPNSLALTPDGTRLYIANADNNHLAVVDVSRAGQSRPLGFVPVGWYPTAVRAAGAGGGIIVANGKGSGSRANPRGPVPTAPRSPLVEDIRSLFQGTISLIAPHDSRQLSAWSLQAYRNSRVADSTAATSFAGGPIPARVGDPSPIRHVIYVIKENRTYDQVFGDIPEGNGDPRLCLFPDSVTPNHHALAREFVLLDNFYCDAEVSADGHNWSMGAYATDFVEKTWPTQYSGRGGAYVYEGGAPIAYPVNGYLWDNCRRNGVTYRSYGEFAENGPTPQDSVRATIEGLAGHVAPRFRAWDMTYSDVDRAKAWMEELDAFERSGDFPRFQIVRLPNDHTEGTRSGSLTPRAYIAQNDLALGMVVERMSRSRFWPTTAVFVVEDDAQNGPDHVDAHRSVALVISPWARRRFVDSELYSTTSMVRTMELILGLPPLTQFDASATPMTASFAPVPDLTPYTARPARIDITARNPKGGYGQARSDQMDFTTQDAIPDVELNEIIWKSIRGEASAMPAPVRSTFVRTHGAGGNED